MVVFLETLAANPGLENDDRLWIFRNCVSGVCK